MTVMGVGMGLAMPWGGSGGASATISLSANTIAENAALGTTVGTLSVVGATGTPIYSLTDTAGSRFAVSGALLQRGATALDYETATSHSITVHVTGTTPLPVDTVFSVTVTNVLELPVNSGAPTLSPTTGAIGTLITCAPGTWSNTPTSYNYQWMRGGVDLGGATSNTYTTVSADNGNTLTCKVQAVNSDGPAAGYTTTSNSHAAGVTLDASTMLGAETNGMAFSASDDSMVIRDTVTPANNYIGSAITKFGAIRAGAGTYFNSSLTLVSSASGLRRDYDPRLAGPKFLFETARTNLMQRSAEANMAAWAKNLTSITADADLAPDGTTTMDRVVTTQGATGTGISQTFTGTAGLYTASCFVKWISGPVWIRLVLTSNAANMNAWFNISTGALGTVSGLTSRISPSGLADVWLLEVTGTCAAVTETFFIRQVTADTSSVSGNIGDTFSTWGMQVEPGPYMSSYIPTGAATATRPADIPSFATSAFNYQTNTVSLYAKYCLAGTNAGTRWLFAQNTRAFELYLNAGTPTVYQDTLGSVVAGSTPAVLTTNKVAAAGAVNDFAMSLNGAAVVTDTATSAMLSATSLTVGQRASANQLDGWMLEGMQLPRRMSNAELVTKAT